MKCDQIGLNCVTVRGDNILAGKPKLQGHWGRYLTLTREKY